jgi:hypothetical protein
MLNTKDDKILNVSTVSRIILRKNVEAKYLNLKQYYYEIKTRGNQVLIKIKDIYRNKVDFIVNDIENLFSTNVVLNNKTISVSREVPKNPIYRQVLVLKYSNTTVTILFPELKTKIPVPRVLKPGIANEDFFEELVKSPIEFINDQVKDIKTLFPIGFSPAISLFVYEGLATSPSAKIGPIKTIQQVGEERDEEGYQKKPDIKITTNSRIENISIKMNIFPEWSSAGRYTAARNIMDYLTKNNIVTITGTKENRSFIYNGNTYSGLVFPATIGEVKKFCFNNTEINYIIVKTFSNDDIISEVSQYGNNLNNFKIDFRVNSIYINNQQGILKLNPDVFLLIWAKNTSATGLATNDRKYDGFGIKFIPKNKIKTNYASILNLPIIQGRL